MSIGAEGETGAVRRTAMERAQSASLASQLHPGGEGILWGGPAGSARGEKQENHSQHITFPQV